MNIRLWARIGLLAVALTVAMLSLAWQAQGAGADQPAPVAVTLKEFTLTAVPPTAAVGDVQFNATNQGVLPHEVVVLKTDLAPGALPRRTGIDRVDEAASGEVIGEIEDTELGVGQSASAVMSLTAGKYVLLCNLEGHYTAGMYTAFTVGAVGTPTATPSATSTASPTPTTSPAPTATASPTPVITPAAVPHAGGPATGSDGFPWAALIVGIGAIVALTGLASVTMIQRQRWR